MAGDAGEHFRPDFFPFMKRKDEIGASLFDTNAMRSALPRDAPSYSQQGPKYLTHGRPAIASCRGKDLRELRDRLTVFHPICENTQRQRLDLDDSFVPALSVGHHARQIRHLREEAPVDLLFYFNPQHETAAFKHTQPSLQ